jgi:hypothetical protein
MSEYENQRFALDPTKYVKETCINPQTRSGSAGVVSFDVLKSYQTCYVDLVPWSSLYFKSIGQVMLEPQVAAGKGMLSAYYVPYLAYGMIQSNKMPPVLLDNVPATGAMHRFIFTGGQNGCSLLLLRGTSPGTVAALHYPNSTGRANGYPLLADVGKSAADILIDIHFATYGETDNPNACSFFWHDGTAWVGITQPQIQGPPDTGWSRCSMSLNHGIGAKLFKQDGSAGKL